MVYHPGGAAMTEADRINDVLIVEVFTKNLTDVFRGLVHRGRQSC